MAGRCFNFNGDLIAGEAGVTTVAAATAPGQTIGAVGALALVKDLAGGDMLIGGAGSTDFFVVDPNTVVVQGAHTGVSTLSAYTNFALPSGGERRRRKTQQHDLNRRPGRRVSARGRRFRGCPPRMSSSAAPAATTS